MNNINAAFIVFEICVFTIIGSTPVITTMIML
jgi:hypothetical protein